MAQNSSRFWVYGFERKFWPIGSNTFFWQNFLQFRNGFDQVSIFGFFFEFGFLAIFFRFHVWKNSSSFQVQENSINLYFLMILVILVSFRSCWFKVYFFKSVEFVLFKIKKAQFTDFLNSKARLPDDLLQRLRSRRNHSSHYLLHRLEVIPQCGFVSELQISQ